MFEICQTLTDIHFCYHHTLGDFLELHLKQNQRLISKDLFDPITRKLLLPCYHGGFVTMITSLKVAKHLNEVEGIIFANFIFQSRLNDDFLIHFLVVTD